MIAPRLITERVTLAINLDDQPPLKACEIDSDLANRELAAEFQASWSLAQDLPEQDFG
jgi:hypothetical protein